MLKYNEKTVKILVIINYILVSWIGMHILWDISRIGTLIWLCGSMIIFGVLAFGKTQILCWNEEKGH